MAGYDLAAMRAQLRFLIRDPAGDAIVNNDVRDIYINPAYRDWWRRYEERPAGSVVNFLVGPGDRSVAIAGAAAKFNDVVYRITVLQPISAVELGIRKSEYNRIRFLQETEGRVGTPREWAAVPFAPGIC